MRTNFFYAACEELKSKRSESRAELRTGVGMRVATG